MITLTANYKEIYQPETVAEIDRLVDNSYELTDILEFIDEHSESDFREYYEEYVEAGENFGYGEVDAFLTLYGLDDLHRFEDCFIGEYSNPARMAEDFLDCEIDRLPYAIVVDWESTADYLIDHDVDRVGDYYFRCFF